jgi:hypothetical protein
MGLMPDQFYSLTWNQYVLKYRGYHNKIEKHKEVIRFATWSIINPNVTKMPPIESFWPLSTDNMPSVEDKAERIKQRLIQAGKEL